MTEVVLVDTNVLLDLFTDDPQWRSWSERALADALMTDGVGINQIVYAEVSLAFGDGEGVVVVPAHLADEVAAAAAAQERLEEFLLGRVQDGASIVGTYPPDEDTLSAYRESRRLPSA